MAQSTKAAPRAAKPLRIHPPVSQITDMLTFRPARLAAVNDRAGNRWISSESGLSVNEWRVLGLTSAMEPARVGRIGGLLLMDKGQLSRIVHGLAGKGLISIHPSSRDARSVDLEMTGAGRELHDRTLALAASRNELVVETLTRDECAEFMRLLQKITQHNEDLLELAEFMR